MTAIAYAPIFDTCESQVASKAYVRQLNAVRRDIFTHDRGIAQNWQPIINSCLDDIAQLCSVNNWDGDGACGVNDATLQRAMRVSMMLNCFVPAGTPAPDLSPSADGEITLSWIVSPGRLFSLSVGDHNNINYAGRLREGFEPHDVAHFDPHDPTPIQQLASFISQLYRGRAP